MNGSEFLSASMLHKVTQLGGFGALLVMIFYIGPHLAERIIDANENAIKQLVANNSAQHITAVEIIREERAMFKEQISIERADCDSKFTRLLERFGK